MKPSRILIVDDEPAMLRSVGRILEQDHDVRCCPSSVEAVALAREFDPQLAVVDIRMPEMDGFELMNELKRQNEDLQVILMTGSIFDLDDQLVRAIREKAFYYVTKPFDREVLRTLVDRCLELRSLEEANRLHVQHLESQLAGARAFQATMLPKPVTTIEDLEVHAEYRPCSELAGDLYDYASAGAGRVALLIADVVGHGASAAMLTAIVKSAFRVSRAESYDPVAVARRVADGIAAFEMRRFVTLLCCRISPAAGKLEFVNAGHNGGLLWGGASEAPLSLATTGPLISPALPGSVWELETLEWRAESRLLLYTDGIPETADQDRMFGNQRVSSILQRGLAGAELLDAVLSEVDAFARGRAATDDMTLLTAGTPCKAARR